VNPTTITMAATLIVLALGIAITVYFLTLTGGGL
jgi:hypothetical protein